MGSGCWSGGTEQSLSPLWLCGFQHVTIQGAHTSCMPGPYSISKPYTLFTWWSRCCMKISQWAAGVVLRDGITQKEQTPTYPGFPLFFWPMSCSVTKLPVKIIFWHAASEQ